MFTSKRFRLASLFATLVMAISMISVDQAEARRGGSFGGRGTRTYSSAPATNTSPTVTAPVQRTMTPAQQQQARPATPAGQQPRGAFGGLGGLMGGLVFGGLLGMMFGGGFGGFGGIFAMLIQLLVIGWIANWLFRRFARPQQAGVGGARAGNAASYGGQFGAAGLGNPGRKPAAAQRPRSPDELPVTPGDLDQFQLMLTQVQTAFGAEDYGTLRRLTTPEMMSYLSEELGENASRGVKNEVSAVTLLQGDVAESWREGQTEYATVAMRYESIDVTRDRASQRVVDGDADTATQTTELWTFVRQNGRDWKLSAIQQA